MNNFEQTLGDKGILIHVHVSFWAGAVIRFLTFPVGPWLGLSHANLASVGH
jgi:hypothetical protein